MGTMSVSSRLIGLLDTPVPPSSEDSTRLCPPVQRRIETRARTPAQPRPRHATLPLFAVVVVSIAHTAHLLEEHRDDAERGGRRLSQPAQDPADLGPLLFPRQ